MLKVIKFLSMAMISQHALALPEPLVTPAPSFDCFSYTVEAPYTGIMYCPLIPVSCPSAPDCMLLEETTLNIPCKDTRCPSTPTVTITGPGACPTCRTGCSSATTTITSTATDCPKY